jgi:hypothetical protein
MQREAGTVRKTLTISAVALAAAAAITLGPTDAHAQGAPPPPPGYEPQAAPPPPGYAPQGYAPQGYAPQPGYAPQGGYYVPPTVAQSGPRKITDWQEGEPIPPGYHPVSRIRTGLVVGGAVTFGVMYLCTALGGAIAHDVGSRSGDLLFIPIAGPFAVLSTGTATGDFFMVLDGLVQAAGVGMLIGGIAAPKTVLVRNDLALTIQPTPMTFGQNSAGFGFKGTF